MFRFFNYERWRLELLDESRHWFNHPAYIRWKKGKHKNEQRKRKCRPFLKRNRPMMKCLGCLVACGISYRKISQMLRLSLGTVSSTCFKRGIKPIRNRGEWLTRDGERRDDLQMRSCLVSAFRHEQRSLKSFDEQNHWATHPAVARHYQQKIRVANYVHKRCAVCGAPSGRRRCCSSEHHAKDLLSKGIPAAKVRKLIHGRNRLETNPLDRLKSQLRSRIHKALRAQNVTKRNRTFELCGCSPAFLRGWLENQFTVGMTWENQGEFWHIDHEIPVAAFDLRDPEQQRRCFHYSNLRPLSAFANMSKHDTIIPTQPELTLPFDHHVEAAGH